MTAVTSGEPPASTTIIDPWGQEYRYRKGSNSQIPDFDLWSIGKNGLTRTGNSDADLSHRDTKDDIRNF